MWSDILLWQQLGEVVKKLLGLFCFSQLCLDVPVRAVANDTGMLGFHRNCKVDERFDSARMCSCCCDISVGIGCISLRVNSGRLRKEYNKCMCTFTVLSNLVLDLDLMRVPHASIKFCCDGTFCE